jgi:serine/threonine-protein kinase
MDVFAFAVSLHEALTGAGLRAGPSLADLDERVRDGDRPPGPARGTIPRWLERILARGAAREPGQRFATAGELVVAVERGRHTQRRRWIGAGAASTALAVGITLALVRDKSQVNPCTRSGDEAAAVWTVGARASLARTLAGDPAASRNVADALDHRIAAWEGMRVEACEATKVRGSQSDALLDRRNACLDRRLDEVRALLARASEPGPRDLARVVTSVDTLAPLATCADTRALLARVPPPEDLAVRRRVDELERTLDDAWALEHLGRYDAALAAAGPLRDAAHAAGYLPLEAETLALLSALHQDKGEAGPAETLLREMVTVAARAKDDVQLADAYAALLNAIGGDAGARSKEALQLIPVAEAAALRASDPRSTIKVMRNSAIVFQRDHQLDEAARRYERVLALQREAFPDDLLGLAKTYGNLCTLEEDRGEHERALASCTHAVDTWRRVRGPDDPASASIVVDLATVDMNLGKYVEARALLDQASTLAERAGQFDMAVVALINVSELDRVAHHSDRAIAVLARAHALIEAKFGPTHPFMAAERMLTGRNLVVAGRLDEAEQALQASLALVEPGDPEVALRLQSLGEIQRLRHRPAEAIPLLERALRIANTATPDVRGAIELELARSLRAAGKDARATDLGRQARASLTAAGVGSKDQLSEAEAFLAVGRR